MIQRNGVNYKAGRESVQGAQVVIFFSFDASGTRIDQLGNYIISIYIYSNFFDGKYFHFNHIIRAACVYYICKILEVFCSDQSFLEISI